MLFQSSSLALLVLLGSAVSPSIAQDECPTSWLCKPTSTPPVIDADHSEWADVEAYTTKLVQAVGNKPYDAGDVSYKCLYDSENIYFALEIPGEYRFSPDSDELCAAIATMFKVGEDATFVNMGGCPDALLGCDGGVPSTCDAHRVDIGAHWELSGTERGTFYGVNTAGSGNSTNATMVSGTGDDPIANKDDEYSVSPTCRFDDDDSNADNEWSGAWDHTNPVEGEFGTYHFELSRKLTTASILSDAQLVAGETIQFGVAFWDPYETEVEGWTDPGHYVTGCGYNWIDLELVLLEGEVTDEANETVANPPPASKTDSASTKSGAEPIFGLSLVLKSFALLSFLFGLV